MNNATHPREKLIHTAARLVHQQGWTITGINQILNEAGIPKGSFYYYFRSKEALGVAVLQLHQANLKKVLESTLLNPALAPDEALASFLQAVHEGPMADVFRYGCPAGNFASEIATQCPALLAEATRALELYREALRKLIERARADGASAGDADPDALSSIALMVLQGALLSYKCVGTVEPLELAHAELRRLVFGNRISATLAQARLSAAHDRQPEALAS
ncbi:MAG: TetR/AcrR family transcriptional regulator [Deltaproteobacteria bacterium]|nr:TetR/AcrR family transcriptional regulator [Deltaproteobacteria bacterium]